VIELILIVLNGIGVYVVRLISIVLKIDGQVGGGVGERKSLGTDRGEMFRLCEQSVLTFVRCAHFFDARQMK
jgi:hypothetical protein